MIFSHKLYTDGQSIDFDKLEKIFTPYQPMKNCLQNPKYHKEGDVWEHTKLTLKEIVKYFDGMDDYGKNVLFLSALLHDIAKPISTKEVNGELETKKHSVMGARMVREILWGKNRIWTVPWKLREEVSNMVLLHSLPVHFINRADPERSIYGSSQVLVNKQLKILSQADSLGRICEDDKDQNYSIEAIQLFETFCKEKDCWDKVKEFPSDNARFRYFFDHKGLSDYDIFEPYIGNVIMMSGIQGSGKSYTIKEIYSDLPVIGLDETREKLDVEFGEAEGEVSQSVKEQCKELMRAKKDFVFNATNTIKDNRSRWIRLFRQYGYSITIHYVEKPIEKTLINNRNRELKLPDSIILEKFSKLDVPTRLECHRLELDVEEA